MKTGEAVRIRFSKPAYGIFIQLIDINQRVVMQKSYDGLQNNIELVTSFLQPGVYILNIKSATGQCVNKISVIK